MTPTIVELVRHAVGRTFEGTDVHVELSDQHECVASIASPMTGRSVVLRVSEYWTEVVIVDLDVGAMKIDDLATEADKKAEIERCVAVAAAYLRGEGQVIRDRSPVLRRARVTYEVSVDGRRWQMRHRSSIVTELPQGPGTV